MTGERKEKLFSGIRVPSWLYDELIKYSEKHNVSHSYMCRDALKLLVRTGIPPSEEKRFINPILKRWSKANDK